MDSITAGRALRFQRHDQSPTFKSLVHPLSHRQDATGIFLHVRPGNADHRAVTANERLGLVASRPREITAGIIEIESRFDRISDPKGKISRASDMSDHAYIVRNDLREMHV